MNFSQRLSTAPRKLKRRYHLHRRRQTTYAPYPLSIYQRFLEQAQERENLVVQRYLERPAKGTRSSNLFVRHDVDTAACIENIEALTAINQTLGIQSGIYFRVDDDEYSLTQHRSTAQALREAGFEVGLHTVCYTEDDYFTELERETKKFAQEVGFQPQSFTVHGLGAYRADVRQRFYQQISNRLEEFGYLFSDCCRDLRRYDYVVEDCHFDSQMEQRFIYDDFISLPKWFRADHDYLVLTHPCYWGQ